MTGIELQWETPSGRATASGSGKAVAERLKGRVDEWAIIEETLIPDDAAEAKKARAQASNRASLISRGKTAPFAPGGTFEAVSRSLNQVDADGKPVIRVYARYRGEEFAVAETPATPAATPLAEGVPAEEHYQEEPVPAGVNY